MTKASFNRRRRFLERKFQVSKSSVKLNELLNPQFSQALSSLAQREIPAKTSFIVATIVHERMAHLATFDIARKGLLDRFAQKDDNGKPKLNEANTEYLFDDRASYDAEFEKLADLEVECSTLERSELLELKTLKAADIIPLHSLIK